MKNNLDAYDLSTEYLSSLKAYWEGRPRTSLERLTTILSIKDPMEHEASRLYRLWIEVLSSLKEHQTLRALLEHFSFNVGYAPDALIRFTALKGIIHFELDEIEAAGLILKSVRSYRHDPYVWELSYRLNRRLGSTTVRPMYKNKRDQLVDYFHLRCYGEAALMLGDQKELRWTISRIAEIYPLAPFAELVTFHGHVDKNQFEKAASVARSLTLRFPLSIEYAFNLGYAYCKSEKFLEGKKELERINDLYPDEDIDVLNWLGFANAQLAIASKSRELYQKATECFEKSKHMSLESGIPVTFPLLEEAKLHEVFEASQKTSNHQANGCWLMKVSGKNYAKFRTAPTRAIRSFESRVSKEVRSGDFCFIFGDDYQKDSKRWRFGALYRVANHAVWHPTGYRSLLELVDRPEIAVPIDVAECGAQNGENSVFRLTESALVSIMKSIEDHTISEEQSVYTKLIAG